MNEKNHMSRKHRRKADRVDFHKIENSPATTYEKEVLEALAQEPSPLEIMMKEEKAEIISKAISEAPLTKGERICVQLFYDGFKKSEIAQKLNKNYWGVRTLVDRGLYKLGCFLTEEGYFSEEKNRLI